MIEFGQRIGDEQEFTVVCDGCPDIYNNIAMSLSVFISDIKSRGWMCKKMGEEWTHFCPDCSE